MTHIQLTIFFVTILGSLFYIFTVWTLISTNRKIKADQCYVEKILPEKVCDEVKLLSLFQQDLNRSKCSITIFLTTLNIFSKDILANFCNLLREADSYGVKVTLVLGNIDIQTEETLGNIFKIKGDMKILLLRRRVQCNFWLVDDECLCMFSKQNSSALEQQDITYWRNELLPVNEQRSIRSIIGQNLPYLQSLF